MKIYYNERLSVKQTSEMLSSLTKLDLIDEDFIKMGELNTLKRVSEFIGKLKNETKVFLYNYQSLGLTLMEFEKLDNELQDNGIQLIFLNEAVSFYASLKKVIKSERQLILNDIIESTETSQEKDSIIGRPKIQTEKRELISYFYHEKKMSMRRVAEKCEVSLGTVHKYAKENTTKR